MPSAGARLPGGPGGAGGSASRPAASTHTLTTAPAAKPAGASTRPVCVTPPGAVYRAQAGAGAGANLWMVAVRRTAGT